MKFSIRWYLWQKFLKRAARKMGFLDPVDFLARIRQFSQPSEVQEPIELIRAGVVFHSRGLINTKVIQNNLDWKWPFWISQQFDPQSKSFLPRAFSFSHINLTQRNWTALGDPGMWEFPIVDPHGMVTPYYDGWSIDVGLISEGKELYPSQLDELEQAWSEDFSKLETQSEKDGLELKTICSIKERDGQKFLEVEAEAESGANGEFVIYLRPCNPEGIQYINEISWDQKSSTLLINKESKVEILPQTKSVYASRYESGDVLNRMNRSDPHDSIQCPAGLATMAIRVEAKPGERIALYRIALDSPADDAIAVKDKKSSPTWTDCLENTPELEVPDVDMVRLYENAKRTTLMLSGHEIVPGPYTYRRFWFRDACLMADAVINLNKADWAGTAISRFQDRQKLNGYFHSQEGEWDSNGQVLWIADQWERKTGEQLNSPDLRSLKKAGDWIISKRKVRNAEGTDHEGLLPAGFSAEHLGPNDYFYWDDLWGIAGLKALARILDKRQLSHEADKYRTEAALFSEDVKSSIEKVIKKNGVSAIPASPYRRMDAGAIGSLVADYPLQLEEIPESLVKESTNWIIENCLQHGAFFQDMIHSGMNAYLTLDIAQTCLRYGDPRFEDLIKSVAELASPTGNWPEAINPTTLGGCMGDGQHGWAAAEWCQMIRSLFIFEEADRIFLGKGLFSDWLKNGETLRFGPTPTSMGTMSFEAKVETDPISLRVSLDSKIRDDIKLEASIPGFKSMQIQADEWVDLPKLDLDNK